MSLLLLLLGCPPDPVDSAHSTEGVEASLTVAEAHVQVPVGAPVALSAEASSGSVVWTFGDGESAEGATVEHVYTSPANYTAVATLTATDGRKLSAAVRVEAYAPHAAIPPVWSSPLAVDAAGRAWVVTPEADTLAVLSEAEAVHLSTCGEPRSVALVGELAWVACGDGTLEAWNTSTLALSDAYALPTASSPWGVVGRDGDVYVVLSALGQLAKLAAGSEWSYSDVGVDPRGVALGSSGEIFVTRFRSDPAAGELYRPGEASMALTLHPGPDSDTLAGGVPTLIEGVAISPDGARVFVPSLQANVHRGSYKSGEALNFETTSRAALGVAAIGAEAEAWEDRKVFDNHDRAIAVAPSPTGNFLAVAHPGTGVVQLLDAYTLDLVGSIPAAGQGLRGLLWTEAGIYTWAWLDRAVTLWSIGEPGSTPEPLWSGSAVAVEPLPADVLLGKQLFHTSADSRISRDGYIACASCHPDGADDGLTWDFSNRGEGLRNTISLEGRAGTGMGALHWSANFDEVQDFENDIRNAFEGTGLLSDEDWALTGDTLGLSKAGRSADLDALAAYVTSLDTPPASPWATRSGAERFESAGCAECHVPPLYTDSVLGEPILHDIGTITAASGGRLGGVLPGLDTPTLLGAWASPPYLHDGSAPTLRAAIAAHGGGLSDGELDELAAYVAGL